MTALGEELELSRLRQQIARDNLLYPFEPVYGKSEHCLGSQPVPAVVGEDRLIQGISRRIPELGQFDVVSRQVMEGRDVVRIGPRYYLPFPGGHNGIDGLGFAGS